MRLWTILVCVGTLTGASACNAPGYSVPGGSQSPAGKKPTGKASKKAPAEKKAEADDDAPAPPPDLPGYAPIKSK